MSMCCLCGQDKSLCEKCSQNYSDMFLSKDISQVEKSIEFNGTLFDIGPVSYIGNKIPEDRKFDWAVHQWNADRKTKFVIAFLRWKPKDQWYDVESCGLRLCEYGSTELLRWIAAKAEELAEIHRREEEDGYGWH